MDNMSKNLQKNKAYIKYSSVAFQMIASILLGAFSGKLMDRYFMFEKPYLTLIGMLLGLLIGFYLILKDLKTK